MKRITINQVKEAITNPTMNSAEFDDVTMQATYQIGITEDGELVSAISRKAVESFYSLVDVPEEIEDIASWEVDTFEQDSNPEFIALCENLTNQINAWIDEQ